MSAVARSIRALSGLESLTPSRRRPTRRGRPAAAGGRSARRSAAGSARRCTSRRHRPAGPSAPAAGRDVSAYLPSRIATIRPNLPSARRSIATFAKVVATIWSSASGWPLRRSYVSSIASDSMPVRRVSSVASASPTLALRRCPNASASPTSSRLGALPDRALRRDDDRVVARAQSMVLGQQRGQGIDVVRRLGDHAPGRRHVRREQRREARVAPEDPEHADALMAAERRPLPIDELLRPGDRRREADAVLGARDVVVHRLRDRDEWDAVVDQHARERQRVVAADGHQRIDARGRRGARARPRSGRTGPRRCGSARPSPVDSHAGRDSASSAPGSSGTCGASCRPCDRWSGCSGGPAVAGSRGPARRRA